MAGAFVHRSSIGLLQSLQCRKAWSISRASPKCHARNRNLIMMTSTPAASSSKASTLSQQEAANQEEAFSSTSSFHDIKRYINATLHSEIVIHNNIVYISGQLAIKEQGSSIVSQTREILSRIDNLLSKVGTNKSRLLTVTIYLKDIKTIGEMNIAYGEWIDKNNKPIRTILQSDFAKDWLDVQIQVSAALKSNFVGVIQTENAAKAVGPYVQGIRLENGLIYASGCIGLDPKTGEFAGNTVEEQTRQTLKNVEEILKAGGADLKNVVRTMVLLHDINDFGKVNEVYKEFFQGDAVPARSCFAAKDLPKGALVEIECTAMTYD